jgi:hypothetical protein
VTDEEIRVSVLALDTTRSLEEERVWEPLRNLGESVVPFLAEAYPRFRRWQGRASLLYHSTRYSRTHEEAFQLGRRALRDRSLVVRYRACGVVAYSLRRDALSDLRELRSSDEQRTREDAAAAIDAIEKQNHHLFIDRSHSGRSFWVVNEADRDSQSSAV